MCAICETRICDIFDELVNGYFVDYPEQRPRINMDMDAPTRSKYIVMEVSSRTESEETLSRFNDMVEAATGIGYTPGEFIAELAAQTGFKNSVHDWARSNRIPNGWVRKIILTRAEMIIRDRGAAPILTLLAAA